MWEEIVTLTKLSAYKAFFIDLTSHGHAEILGVGVWSFLKKHSYSGLILHKTGSLWKTQGNWFAFR